MFSHITEYRNERLIDGMRTFKQVFAHLEKVVMYKYIEYCNKHHFEIMDIAVPYVPYYRQIEMAAITVMNWYYVLTYNHTTMIPLYTNIMNVVIRMDACWINRDEEYNKRRNAFIQNMKKIYGM
jgi:hypothetical protein